MNSNNTVEQFLDDYYNVILERNDEDRVVITPAYVDSHRKEMEDMITLL